MEPLNYQTNVADPMARTLAGYQGGLDMAGQMKQQLLAQEAGQRAQEMHPLQMQGAQLGLEQTAQNMQIQQQQADQQAQAFAQQQAAAARQEAWRAQFGDLIKKGKAATFDDVAALNGAYPEMSSATQEYYSGLNEDRQKPLVATLGGALAAIRAGQPDIAKKIAYDFVGAARNTGDEQLAGLADAASKMIDINPDIAAAQLGLMLHQIDPTIAKDVIEGTGIQVRSSDILPDGTVIAVTDKGTRVTSPDGRELKGEEAALAIKAANAYGVDTEQQKTAARETGKLETQAGLGAAASGAEALGKLTIEKAGQAYDALGKVRQNVSNIDEALSALDRGANSGAVAKFFPNITEASASLENAMSRMGLDVIGSVTFGALSESEMKLAMETAVPRNLSEPDLRTWLQRKKDAQNKAFDALFNAASYLSKPGNTLNTWIEQQRGGSASDIASQLLAKMKADPSYIPTDAEMQQLQGGGQ